MLLLFGCGVKVEDLPFRRYPVISRLEFLQDIEVSEDRIRKTVFPDPVPRFPLVIFLKLKAVEGPGTLQLRIYGENREQVYARTFPFGKPGRYYDYIVLYNRIEDLPGTRFRYAVFYNRDLICSGSFGVNRSVDAPPNSARKIPNSP